MRRTLTYAWRTLSLGITAYALVYTRDVPKAYAETIIDTDCSTDLTTPNATYHLQGDVTSCVVAADNIIIDGQNIQSATSIIASTTATVNFTVRNMFVGGSVRNNAGAGHDAGNLTIENTHIVGALENRAPSGYAGSLTVTDSQIDGDTSSYGYGSVGATTITHSIMGGIVDNIGGYDGGAVTITQSTTTGRVRSFGGTQRGGEVTITESHIGGYVSSSASSGYGTQVTISESSIMGDIEDTAVIGDRCTITDSMIASPHTDCSGNLTLINNPPSLTVTPLTLSLEQGDSFNPFSGVSADDVLDGDLSGEVNVVGSVGEEPGTYDLVYSVSDHEQTLENIGGPVTSGPSTASTTRTVTREGDTTSSGNGGTWVGHRSDGGGPTHTTDTSSTTTTTSTTTSSLDATLAELRTVLAQPITTTDTTKLAKLVDLLTQLLAVLVQLIAKGG